MKILVTGASGFIGGTLCPVLAARGHEVRALNRGTTGDLSRFSEWPRALEGIDAVVHLAAIAHVRGTDERRMRAVNVDLPLALGRAAAQAGVPLLFMSSAKVHGESTVDRPFDGSSLLAPEDAYARAKVDAETGLRALEGLNLTVIRPPLVYGPGVKANFMILLRAIARGWPLPFAGVENRRSLVSAANLADAAARCVEAPAAIGRTYLVSDGPAVSTPALCRALGAALGVPTRLFPFPSALLELAPPMRKLTRSLELDGGAIQRELGWLPPHTFGEELRKTAAWYLGTV